MTQLVPNWPYLPEVYQKEHPLKEEQKELYDQRHQMRDLLVLPSETGVWVTSRTSLVEVGTVG